MFRIQRGFTLFELVIYLSVFSLFSVLIFSQFSGVSLLTKSLSTYAEQDIIQIGSVRDLIIRDIMSASSNLHDWDVQAAIFKSYRIASDGTARSDWIGWTFDSKSSTRTRGIYKRDQRTWNKNQARRFPFACPFIKLEPVIDEQKKIITMVRVITRHNPFIVRPRMKEIAL